MPTSVGIPIPATGSSGWGVVVGLTPPTGGVVGEEVGVFVGPGVVVGVFVGVLVAVPVGVAVGVGEPVGVLVGVVVGVPVGVLVGVEIVKANLPQDPYVQGVGVVAPQSRLFSAMPPHSPSAHSRSSCHLAQILPRPFSNDWSGSSVSSPFESVQMASSQQSSNHFTTTVVLDVFLTLKPPG